MLPRPLAALALLALGLALPAHAQDDDVARLRARVAAAPTDTSLRCQLAFALVGAGGFDEAVTVATSAILDLRTLAAYRSPLTPTTRRLYGACLYNRGRAHEGRADAYSAALDYVDSLALRPNDTVLARLTALVPGTRQDYPASALVILDPAARAHHEARPLEGVPIAHVRSAAGPWDFVAASVGEPGGSTTLATYAVAWHADAVERVERIDEWTQDDDGGGITIDGARVISPPGITSEVAVLTVHATGGGTCGQMDGFMDFEHVATILVELGGEHRSRVLVTSQADCDDPVHMRIRVAASGVVVSSSRGGELAPGTYPIADLLR